MAHSTTKHSIQSTTYGTIPGSSLEPAPPPSPTAAEAPPPPAELQAYWWRWGVLGVFVLNMATNNLMWITFAPIADVMRCYYGITNDVVNTLSLVSAVLTLVLVLPGSWLLLHFGIRFVMVVASAATALGGALRVGGAGSQYFSLLITGQTVSSLNGLMTGATSLFSETWFPSSERATATAIAASVAPQVCGWGMYVGGALCYHVLLPPPQVCTY